MAWQMALMALPAVLSLGTSVFSFFKGQKVKKQCMAQMQVLKAQDQALLAQAMSKFQGQNLGAVNGMNSSFMLPSGIGGPGASYGPAGPGYFPPGFC